MYIPEHFEITDPDEIRNYVKKHSFGQLISLVDKRPFSTHVPFLLEKDQLVCHIARQNPQWESIDGQEVLVSFQGSHAYVSPSWYQSPGVPTWNYQAVHIYGEARSFDGVDRLRNLVEKLSAIFEVGEPKPWEMEFSQAMLNHIVGIEISITEVQGKYKLSQNRPEADRRNVIDQLREAGDVSLSRAMQDMID